MVCRDSVDAVQKYLAAPRPRFAKKAREREDTYLKDIYVYKYIHHRRNARRGSVWRRRWTRGRRSRIWDGPWTTSGSACHPFAAPRCFPKEARVFEKLGNPENGLLLSFERASERVHSPESLVLKLRRTKRFEFARRRHAKNLQQYSESASAELRAPPSPPFGPF